MLELLILAALGAWLALALRSCLRRRGKGGCDGCCDRCGQSCKARPAAEPEHLPERPRRPDLGRRGLHLQLLAGRSSGGHSHFFRLKYQSRPITTAALTRITAG